jgi:hypothetical protein
MGERIMTNLSDQLQAVSICEIIKLNEELHKIYPNKLYGAFALREREKYYKLTGREYIK